jgi:hypothetical protein
MNLTVETEQAKFKEAMDKMLLLSKRELSVAVNARMSFLLMRVFVLLPPRRVQEARNKVRSYLNHATNLNQYSKSGRKIGRKRILQRVHLIAQAKNKKAGKKGLYGQEMKDAVAYIRRRSINSVGYLKSALIPLIRAFNATSKYKGHFAQFGRRQRSSKDNPNVITQKAIEPNAAFIKLIQEYGLIAGHGNVGIHKGAKHGARPATPGINPIAIAAITIGIAEDQQSKVRAIYDEAMTTAFHDERKEMERQIAIRLQAAAEEAAP